jgi:thioredoxin 1
MKKQLFFLAAAVAFATLPCMTAEQETTVRHPIDLSSEQQFNEIITNNTLVVVDFYGTFCQPCNQFAPIFSRVAAQFPHVVFIKVNVQAFPGLAHRYNVSSIPTLLFIKNGVVTQKRVGFHDEATFAMLAQRLAQA